MKTRKIIVCCDRKEDADSLIKYMGEMAQNKTTGNPIPIPLLDMLEAQVEELERQRKMIERGKVRVDDDVFQNCLKDYTKAEVKEIKERK